MATEVERLSHTIVTKKGASKQRTRFIKTISSYLLLGGISLVLLTPLLWMIFTSLKPMTEIVQFPPTFSPKQSIGKII